LSSIAFAVLWTGGMLWSTGPIDRANIIILSICGALAGCAWYYAMRWVFRFIHLLPHDDHSVEPRQ
jgi:membrane protein DedA with SNARE-associated domain